MSRRVLSRHEYASMCHAKNRTIQNRQQQFLSGKISLHTSLRSLHFGEGDTLTISRKATIVCLAFSNFQCFLAINHDYSTHFLECSILLWKLISALNLARTPPPASVDMYYIVRKSWRKWRPNVIQIPFDKRIKKSHFAESPIMLLVIFVYVAFPSYMRKSKDYTSNVWTLCEQRGHPIRRWFMAVR